MTQKDHLVEDLHRFVELYVPQERGQILEKINQQLCVHGPTLEDSIGLEQIFKQKQPCDVIYVRFLLKDLLLWGVCKHPGNEDAMRNQFQPGVHKTRCFGGSQDVEGIAADKGKRWTTTWTEENITRTRRTTVSRQDETLQKKRLLTRRQ